MHNGDGKGKVEKPSSEKFSIELKEITPNLWSWLQRESVRRNLTVEQTIRQILAAHSVLHAHDQHAKEPAKDSTDNKKQ